MKIGLGSLSREEVERPEVSKAPAVSCAQVEEVGTQAELYSLSRDGIDFPYAAHCDSHTCDVASAHSPNKADGCLIAFY